MTAPATIHRETLADAQKAAHTAKLFGIRFPLYVEPFVFDNAGGLSNEYSGGLWDFHVLSNGGFYMSPVGRERYRVECDNGFEGELSSDAFGIAACLYAYSLLSFTVDEAFADLCGRHYHLLRDYMLEHREAAAILKATD